MRLQQNHDLYHIQESVSVVSWAQNNIIGIYFMVALLAGWYCTKTDSSAFHLSLLVRQARMMIFVHY